MSRPPLLTLCAVALFSATGFPIIASAQPAPGSAPVDTATVLNTARQRIALFQARWQQAWIRSDINAVSGETDKKVRAMRITYGHCDYVYGRGNGRPMIPVWGTPDTVFTPIVSNNSAYALCPSWLLGTMPRDMDEARYPDAAIRTGDTLHIRQMREDLIRSLDGFQDLLPDDGFLRMQRVRFLVDAHRYDRAERALDTCGDTFACLSLRGYVAHERGDVSRADSLFVEATSRLDELSACSWIDLRQLLPDPPSDSPRDEYAFTPCSERHKIARMFWWLSDPLFSVAGNERRATHFARRVWYGLHSGMDRDQRHDWRKDYGGDAVEELITRYGPPSAALWIGEKEDRLHDSHVGELHAGPYTTVEYTSGRQSFTPSLSAVYSPYAVGDSSWQLHQRDSTHDAMDRGRIWWPHEHMAFEGRIAEMPLGQVAMLRRYTGVTLAVTHNLFGRADTVLTNLRRDSAEAVLVVSPAPDTMNTLGRGRVHPGGSLFTSALIPSEPAVVSVEARHPRLRNLFGRSRFGVRPPAALSALAAGQLDISAPVFYDAARGGTPPDAPGMFPHMLATTMLRQGDRIGIFWETYGVTPGDSVQFRVAIERTTRPGFLQRIGEVTRLRDVPLRALGIAWRDPDTRTTMSEGPSIMPRAISLDLGDLEPGEYRVVVEARARDGQPVRSERALTIIGR
ncbi:MAG: hypothetical protein C0516_01360 [Gemmatimonas sp.]|nr:hypothetical protein [Gemmatimonas sp.]